MMSTIREELINATVQRSYTLIDYNIYNDIHKQHKFQKQTVLADKSLTKDEKTEAIRLLNRKYDRDKILNNEGTKRICENCNQECLATLYCEHCVRNYLKENFSNWASGNDNIDILIQKCQIETLRPNVIIEWIPYNNLQNIEYLTKGGCSEIYTAHWIGGSYDEWDSKERQLKRFGTKKVILKRLENVESANQSWFEEAKSHLSIGNKWTSIVQCYGLTQDPTNGNYMLVMMKLDIDLRKYLQQNHNQLTWKEKIRITFDMINSLSFIHRENAIHRDLHSGNILYSQFNDIWRISDLGFCGPADKPSKSIYGNLPYIAPEVIAGKKYTYKSDIYSIAMLMWEISSEKPPFINYKYDDYYDLAMDIINGMRPKIVSGVPLEYKSLMEQCWDADPLKRPDIGILKGKIRNLHLSYNKSNKNKNFQKVLKNFNLYQLFRPKTNNNLEINETSSLKSNYTDSILFTSKVHQFENVPEPRNATEEEQEAFHSKQYDFSIPDNVDDFNESNSRNDNSISKISSVFKRISRKPQINSNNDDIQDDYKREAMHQHIKRQNIDNNDEDEIYNNPNLHSEEQDELEIPDDGF